MFGFDLEQIKKASPLGEMISGVIGIPVDCKGLELTSQTEQTVPGLYEAVKSAYATGNPILAKGLQWEGDPFSPVCVGVTYRSSGNYICTFSTLQIEVAPDDGVTITNMLAG